MRERELKQLFERLILVAVAPVPLVTSCAGVTQGVADATGGSLETGGSMPTGGGGSSATTTAKGLGGFLGTVVMTGGTNGDGGSSSTATTRGLGGFLGTVAMTGGTKGDGGSSTTATTRGLGGFLGTVAMTGGTRGDGGSSSTATTRGLGGFLGTVAMTGGTRGDGGSSSTATTTGIGGFVGVGGASARVVTCPDSSNTGGAGNTGGTGMVIGCGSGALCVEADISGLGTSALDSALCSTLCGVPTFACTALTTTTPTILKCTMPCTGRRPDGLTDVESYCDDELGQYFSEIAHLEAASVAAFRALGRQLTRFGAPRSLRQAVRQAARDEIHHARLGRRLAERFSGRYVSPSVSAKRDVTLETVARENAVEGCVRETYGALLAKYQAHQAADPEVRKAMRQIARDETRHAAIAWAIARWVEPRLDADARQRVHAARNKAVLDLMSELGYQAPETLQQTAGVPAAGTARGLARALASELWV